VTGASDGAGTIYRSASQAWSEAFPRGQWSSQVMHRTKTWRTGRLYAGSMAAVP
jgi:hypothetical protein